MAELLLELFSEEIPARMQGQAAADLRRLVSERLTQAGLAFGQAESFATPRRLALVIDGLPSAQPDVREERRGPRADAPEKAIEGFLRGAGLSRDQVEVRETDLGAFLFAVIERTGQPTAAVLPELLGPALAEFPWPKSMRWGDGGARWVRPLHGLLCLFDGAVVDLSFAGVTSGDQTRGHRFHAPAAFAVTDFADYRDKLRAARVMLDGGERRVAIEAAARKLAAAEGLALVDDPGLLDEVAGLVEWPVVLLGEIDSRFMALPREVLVSSMRGHQKYLALTGAEGKLAPRFIVVANLEATDGGATILGGNRRVLSARLADAEFFWQSDRKRRLDERAPELDQIVFHAKVGTLGEKVARMAALARALATHVPGADAVACERAAKLAKADLTSEMVGEFPELQGIMGRYYAQLDGEPAEVAQAIAEHYAPQGPNDQCPSAPVSVVVALADKIDTLAQLFAAGERSTGSRDPFALRRAALGVIRLILENKLRLPLRVFFLESARDQANADALMDFVADRLKVHLREAGARHDLIAAVLSPGQQGGRDDDLVRLIAKVEILGEFLGSDDGANLLVAYRRAANIVRAEENNKKRRWSNDGKGVDVEKFSQPQETALYEGLRAVLKSSPDSIEVEMFTKYLERLSTLRQPIDNFFDDVTVNTDDDADRDNRLKLLDDVKLALNTVADFGQIEG